MDGIEPLARGMAHGDAAAWRSPCGTACNDHTGIVSRLAVRSASPEQTAQQATDKWCNPVAPSPDTPVVAERRRAIDAEQRVRAREAAFIEQHREEVARLTASLRRAEETHAAEIKRLRADHAAEMLKLVGDLWTSQDLARAATQGTGDTVQAETLPAAESSFQRWWRWRRVKRRGRLGQ